METIYYSPNISEDIEVYDIPGFEKHYCATRDGRIYSLKSKKFLSKSDDTYGYDTVCLSRDGDQKTYKVHKLMAKTFLENPNSYTSVDHINRDRKDNSIENLRYVSTLENNQNRSPSTKPKNLKHIQIKRSTFKVSIKPNNKPPTYKSFKTLNEAIEFRDNYFKNLLLN